MEQGFRASMNGLHTWAGVILGGVLFAIFWMGSLSVFDREIDRWMAPMSRLAPPGQERASLETLRPLYDEAVAAKASTWYVIFPTPREPALSVLWRVGGRDIVRFVDPATGAALPEPGTLGGTRFIYPFHYMLHIRLANLGYWIVGLAAMAMLALCVSGVVIHRKIFTDFFTFRADKKPRRLLLDLHNVTGVLGLPFHFVITLSGLVIFWSTYFPLSWQMAYQGDRQAMVSETYDIFRRPKAGSPGGLGSLDGMMAELQRRWDGGTPRYVFVTGLGDAAAVAQFGRIEDDAVEGWTDIAFFDLMTGAFLHERRESAPVMTAQRFITGMHMLPFRHWTLRWLYFGLGLIGCVLIATGYLFWLESRRRRHADLGLPGVRIVEGLAIGSVTGILIATCAYLVANRLLPLGATLLGVERAALEVWTFYLVWLATFVHAWGRPGRAWAEQCGALAAVAIAAVALNWITTGDHLVRSLVHRHLWPIAGMDLVLLVGALAAGFAARRLSRRRLAATRVRHA
ncbi:PepSY-associated TM helix domain-containing protein [Reyranella sp.]|uniref:PepSY-associated TM helix domain-containing protein n=1 Tax=Reyranella sp. TaxID=1929291 RepID=UPI003BAAE262